MGLFGGGGILGTILDPGDILGAGAAADAADFNKDLGYKGLQLQQDWLDYIKGQFEPYSQAGLGALGKQLQAIEGMRNSPSLSDIARGEDYAILKDRQMRDINAINEATGNVGSSTGYNSIASVSPNILMNLRDKDYSKNIDYINQLGGVSGRGIQGGQGIGSFGGNTLSGMMSTMSGLGTGALNSAAMQQQQGTGLLSGVIGMLGSLFSDVRLKDDIEFTGEKTSKGNEIYKWKWNKKAGDELGLTGEAYGVLADKAKDITPDAVTIDENTGYKKVDYARV